MKEKYRKYASLILTTIFFVQLTQTTYAQESLSADTPFIEVNGKTIKFGSAIIAFSKIRQNNIKFNEETIFSQIVQQLVNEELLSQKINPSEVSSKPQIISRNVDFPLPDGPTIP